MALDLKATSHGRCASTCGKASGNSGDLLRSPGCCNKWCDHIAIAVAESDDLIAFHFLMAAEPNVVATFLRRGCRPITMNDGRFVEQIWLEEGSIQNW